MACCLAPLCMFGSPADFWFVAVGALVSTVAGCIIVLVKVRVTLLTSNKHHNHPVEITIVTKVNTMCR